MYMSPRLGPLRLCGEGRFSRDTEGPEMVVTFQSARNTPGGRFACYIQSISQQENCRCGWKKPVRLKENSIPFFENQISYFFIVNNTQITIKFFVSCQVSKLVLQIGSKHPG